MKKILSIIVCKCLCFIGKIFNRGSSLPGKIALRIDPDILSKIKLPDKIIAVTGSNGKTSTCEMIAKVLKDQKINFSFNKEGSNQIEGVTTFILSDCTLFGKVKSDVILLETDERYAKKTFTYFKPTYYVITNLYRDQLTRNGHPVWVYNDILKSIYPDTTLILNADDPLVSSFSLNRNNTVWFGVDRLDKSYKDFKGMYNDTKYCPNCFSLLEYDYYHYGNIGKYKCSNCDFMRNEPDYAITQADLSDGYIIINNETKISLKFPSMYYLYNILAAFALCCTLEINKEDISDSLSNYFLTNGRIVNFKIGEHSGTFLASKHENSTSYNQSLTVAANAKKESLVLLMIDRISRKYFTSETSWLFDIDFDILKSPNIKEIVLAGAYCNDLAWRFQFTDIDQEKIKVIDTIEDAVVYIKDQNIDNIYAITCFADKDKFINNVEIL